MVPMKWRWAKEEDESEGEGETGLNKKAHLFLIVLVKLADSFVCCGGSLIGIVQFITISVFYRHTFDIATGRE
ncbi:hypothetical protein Hanom_Chr08g00682791 [Helianthus anomalus]